ncbi:hypothetical protein CIB48_g1019 [Xylaria polymorpha]|nr:hypothetical protein CIB48_g1019 [Xylaria polymorpha]
MELRPLRRSEHGTRRCSRNNEPMLPTAAVPLRHNPDITITTAIVSTPDKCYAAYGLVAVALVTEPVLTLQISALSGQTELL